ncbi:pilus assembly protein PilM [Budvicia diplopodorum]|uniref:pilus assembly protein PilM n=1 Tax=Budvicia diplopodorum TaxID=1119056 RepID=UPI00135786CB|nr:pilus assembly protein PilM [Budvicia diplopodorum]
MQIWQVGLDIQESGFYAFAVQRQRYGWQLRHWWHQSVAAPFFSSSTLTDSHLFIDSLKKWRQKLPKGVSIRIALPASAILQQSVALPDQKLSPQEQDWFVGASVGRLFPLAARELAVDYRITRSVSTEPPTSTDVVITAAKRSDVDRWVTILAKANIIPTIIDTVPCVLRSMASMAGLNPDYLLVHQLEHQYLLVSPLKAEFNYRLLPNDGQSCPQRVECALLTYRQLSGCQVDNVYFSGLEILPEQPDNVHCWSPMVALHQMQPPLPEVPHQFVLACGLALRREDA